MKDVFEVLRAKEQEMLKLKRQIEALRVAAPLLSGEEDDDTMLPKPVAASREKTG
ncbi:MAG TPA: hypothetical protein VND65_15995 [Candidatus Binatia bacterium]|nr:hypothetical protein [Candidatus Binatia bacterium]